MQAQPDLVFSSPVPPVRRALVVMGREGGDMVKRVRQDGWEFHQVDPREWWGTEGWMRGGRRDEVQRKARVGYWGVVIIGLGGEGERSRGRPRAAVGEDTPWGRKGLTGASKRRIDEQSKLILGALCLADDIGRHGLPFFWAQKHRSRVWDVPPITDAVKRGDVSTIALDACCVGGGDGVRRAKQTWDVLGPTDVLRWFQHPCPRCLGGHDHPALCAQETIPAHAVSLCLEACEISKNRTCGKQLSRYRLR